MFFDSLRDMTKMVLMSGGGGYIIYETYLDVRAAMAHIDIACGQLRLLLPKKLRLHFDLSFYALPSKRQ